MNIKNGLKSVGLFVKDVVELVGPVVVGGVLLSKSSKPRTIMSYDDAISIVLQSSMWSEDKAKVASALPMDANPELYGAVISVVKSSMWSNDKMELILKMCNQAEEA